MKRTSLVLASGIVKSFDNEYSLAGVPIFAYLPHHLIPVFGTHAPMPIELARTVSGTDGSFTLELNENSPGASFICILENCEELGIQVVCKDLYDFSDLVLAQTEVLPAAFLQNINIQLASTDWKPDPTDWQSLGLNLKEFRIATLDHLAGELAYLAPAGVFHFLNLQMRLGLLYGLENKLIDPAGLFMESGFELQNAQLQDPETREGLRQQLMKNSEFSHLVPIFDQAVSRLDSSGGHLANSNLVLDWESFQKGNAGAGVVKYFGESLHELELVHFDDLFFTPDGLQIPHLGSELTEVLMPPDSIIGYRNYLLDVWAERATKQVVGQNFTDRENAVGQLAYRFFQDFSTINTNNTPANQVLCPIIREILMAQEHPFGFSIPDWMIEPQGDRTHREYLDYLVSLSKLTLPEFENRYRMNLARTDMDMSNPVQQNIDTLQRFFTDSFHSEPDPWGVFPELSNGVRPIINEWTFPRSAHGPFFWQYEEWTERNQPFYGENFFDIRKTFSTWSDLDPEGRKKLFEQTMPTRLFIANRENRLTIQKFALPAVSNSASFGQENLVGDQWNRMMLEIQDWLNDAHNDFYAGRYSGAETKYRNIATEIYFLNSLVRRWENTAWHLYTPSSVAASHRAFKIKDPLTLDQFERKHHFVKTAWTVGRISPDWRLNVAYSLDLLQHRLLPACLAEARAAQGKYLEAILGGDPANFGEYGSVKYETTFAEALAFGVFSGPSPVEPGASRTPVETIWWQYLQKTGSLPFATNGAIDDQKRKTETKKFFPANAVEKAWFRLKMGEILLDWADLLYRTNRPESIQRARELYKGVLFVHSEDPKIAPSWNNFGAWSRLFKGPQNPQLTAQVNRARVGFEQINSGLNFYGFENNHLPPVRYRVLREAALSLAASAKSAQMDFLRYMQAYEQSVLDEMTARTMIEKASNVAKITKEQVEVAKFSVREAQKQVEGVKAQIAQKIKEDKDKEDFFNQIGDFIDGVKGAAKGLVESAKKSGENNGEETAGGDIDAAAVYTVVSTKGTTTAAAAGLTGAMALTAGYAAFVYVGVSSISSIADAANKRSGEIRGLREGVLPAAEKFVELKTRDVKVAEMQQAIAEAEYNFAKKLLEFHQYRFQNQAFWQQMTNFSNRLMRRYLDLGGRMAWFAERALAFETDREIQTVSFDYFPKNLRGVTGADTLQLHLAELEASRIFGLSQTVPVKQTFSLMRDFPLAFGQLKKHGICQFRTSETPFRLAYPGIYGYRLRNVSVGATYTNGANPHKGMLRNNGFSIVSRKDNSQNRMLRYPDALPLSEFNLRGDMLVYDLPDETLLPFEGSGVDTFWELRLSQIGDATGLESLSDVLITFDMRATYSPSLDAIHQAAVPTKLNKSLLISGGMQNRGTIAKFKSDGDTLKLTFRPDIAAANVNEKMRKVTFVSFLVIGLEKKLTASITAETDDITAIFDFVNGSAMSNAGFLKDSNNGVPLPLNDITGISADQPFVLNIKKTGANSGVNFSELYDVQMLIEYEADI